MICNLFQKNQKGWVFHIHVLKKRIKVLSGFEFEKGVVVNQIHLYDYSSIRNCVWECEFHILCGKLPTSLLNVTRFSKRSPTHLLLVEDQVSIVNYLCDLLIITTTGHHPPRYKMGPNINNPNSVWKEAYILFNFL